ncbi:KIAA1456 [Bugula neritina]|uniref:KIAA1456 n=1 Tax=Bugula neritina TaxID=10212 RepID=A0A7J7KH19_BUGNE|nr:KIAA1456 [Bugula neritina]
MNSSHLSRGDSEIRIRMLSQVYSASYLTRKKEREEKSKLLEQLYVHDVYDRIASDFEEQQYQPWPKVKDFLLGLESGSLVADVGCGNGHYLNVNPNISVIGVDRSFNLLRAAESRVPGVNCRADCVALPFRDNQFDAVLFIGVMHHLVSSERQVKALLELSRILRPGGTILLYTWAYEQQKRKFNGQDLLVPRYPSVGEDNPHCNCHRPTTKSSGDQLLTLPNQSQLSVLDKLERIFVRPFNLFINLFKLNSHEDSIETGESKDYINSVPSTQSDTLDDKSINLITKCSNSIYSNTPLS